jgi:redox-sensitive bicupin YhaK (pirin superfamily)
MIKVRKANERGGADHGWLDTKHTFSFANYYDPNQMGFRSLRVINEDRVQPREGFGTHGHANMEILSYVVSGALAHKDSTGNSEVLRPDEWQVMTAGRGVRHSEYNGSDDSTTHFYQIWILPEKDNLEPAYDQKFFAPAEKQGKLKLVASPNAAGDSLKINQDVKLFNSVLANGEEISYELDENRYAWIQVVKGKLAVGDETLEMSDGAAISNEKLLQIKSLADDTEFLLFDLN